MVLGNQWRSTLKACGCEQLQYHNESGITEQINISVESCHHIARIPAITPSISDMYDIRE